MRDQVASPDEIGEEDGQDEDDGDDDSLFHGNHAAEVEDIDITIP